MKIFSKIAIMLIIAVMLSAQVFTTNADNNINVIINGTQLSFDQNPVMINGRVMVPMRAIFEAFNSTVFYDSSPTYNNFTLETIHAVNESGVMRMDHDSTYDLNGYNWYIKYYRTPNSMEECIETDVSPIVINDRILVPVRLISEVLGANVPWDETTSTVIITGNIPEKWHLAGDYDKISNTSYKEIYNNLSQFLLSNGIEIPKTECWDGIDYYGRYSSVKIYDDNTSYNIKYYYDDTYTVENYPY